MTYLPVYLLVDVCFCRQKRLDHLCKEHPEIHQWATSSEDFTAAVKLLCDLKAEAWQSKVEQLVRRYQILQWLQQRGGDNCRSEHKHMRKQRNQVSKDIQEAIKVAADWELQGCSYQQEQQQQQRAGKSYCRCAYDAPSIAHHTVHCGSLTVASSFHLFRPTVTVILPTLEHVYFMHACAVVYVACLCMHVWCRFACLAASNCICGSTYASHAYLFVLIHVSHLLGMSFHCDPQLRTLQRSSFEVWQT